MCCIPSLSLVRRCSASGNDLMHRQCASMWFGDTRQSTTCEVCREEAVGLPSEVKGRIRYAASLLDSTGQILPASGRFPRLITCSQVHPNRPSASVPSSSSSSRQQHRAVAPSSLRSFTSVPAYLGSYAAFCLLPAMLASLSLIFFFLSEGCNCVKNWGRGGLPTGGGL